MGGGRGGYGREGLAVHTPGGAHTRQCTHKAGAGHVIRLVVTVLFPRAWRAMRAHEQRAESAYGGGIQSTRIDHQPLVHWVHNGAQPLCTTGIVK